MFQQRNLKLDLTALGLLALVIFLALSLGSYRVADPVPQMPGPLTLAQSGDQVVYPAGERIANLCGRLGAITADVLLNSLGVGAYYAVFCLAVLDVLLLMRREINTPVIRTFGWLLTLLGVTSLSAMLLTHFSPGPVIGAGGYLGTVGLAVLENYFASAGALVLAITVTAAGILLCTDYVLFSAAAVVFRRAGSVASAGGMLLLRRRKAKPAAAKTDVENIEEELADSDDEEIAEEDGEEAEPAIRIRGKRLDADDEEHADEEWEEEAAEDELDDEQPAEEEDIDEQPAPAAAEEKAPPAPRFKVRRPPSKEKIDRDEVIEALHDADETVDPLDYELPTLDLLTEGDDFCYESQEKEVRRKAKLLEQTFKNFGFNVRVVEIETGPVIAQYEVELEAGLRLSKITGLADDLAIALRVPSVRIVAPIPGKNTVGIEVPNEERQVVRLREVMEESAEKMRKMQIPIFLGKDVSGNPLISDLAKLPHLLIAGRTGTGKSVCLNAIISSMLMTRRPDEVRMLMIDPKMVELSGYRTLPHLMHPVVTDMRKAEAILAWAVEKMEERYQLLARAGVRHVSSYNQLDEEELMDRIGPESEEEAAQIPRQLPFIVIVADEMADLMMTAGKDVEQHIIRLAQKSRAVGIHLILATQKPTVDVITGLIKSNLPARISFQVASRTDSRVVLDEMGAEKLLGNGDMLFLWPGTSTLLRGQGTYLSDDEIDALVDVCSQGEQNFVKELVHLKVEDKEAEAPEPLKQRDELYEAAVDVVVREGRGSVSLLQRALGIGYGRAARLIDFMAEDGIVGPYAGSQAREVAISLADWEQMRSGDAESAEDEATAPADDAPRRRRSNKIVPEHDDDEIAAEEQSEEFTEDEYEDAEYDSDEADDDDEWEEDEYEEDEYEEESATGRLGA